MGAMLILKAVLLLGVASESRYLAVSSTPTSENPVTSTTSKSRRDLTTGYPRNPPYSSTTVAQDSSQPGTTVKSNVAPSPTQSVTFSPYQYQQGNVQKQQVPTTTHGQYVPSTSTQPALQGGFQASQDPRQINGNNGFVQTSAPFNPQSSQRIQNKVTSGGNRNSPFLANHGGFRLHQEPSKASAHVKLSSFTNPGGGEKFSRFKSSPAARTNRQSPTGFDSFEGLSKFSFNPSSTFNLQANSPLVASPQRSKNNIFQSDVFPGRNNLANAPTPFTELSGAPSFKSFNKLAGNYQYPAAPTAAYANKQISIPDKLQFQTTPDISGFVQAFENEPVILNDYQAQPASGLSFDFPKSTKAPLPNEQISFAAPIGNYQPRILPVHSSTSTLQLPQYKGASVNAFANNPQYSQTPNGGYQLLANQPQLHFTKSNPLQPLAGRQPITYHSNNPFEQIRADVEVIKKKKPQLPKPDDSYEDDFDQDFNLGKGVSHFIGDVDVDISAPVKKPVQDISFEVPKSNAFKSYDEAFGKYSKLASIEQSSLKSKPKSKPVYQSAEDDDDKEEKSEEYRSGYSGGNSPSSSYEDEEEEESRRNERRQSRGDKEEESKESKDEKYDDDDDDDDDEDDRYGSDTFDSYGVDFEKEFEASYLKELPKNEYVHVKEVPEIEEPLAQPRKHKSKSGGPKSSRASTKEQSRRVVQDADEEPKKYESLTIHRYEKPKTTYRDSVGHGSRSTYSKSAGSPDAAPRERYGYKLKRDRGAARYGKIDDSEAGTTNENRQQLQPIEPLADRDTKPPISTRLSANAQRSVSSTLSPIELINTFTFPPFSSAKTGKQLSTATDSYGASSLRANPSIVNSEGQAHRSAHRQGLRYFPNGHAARDLTGI